MAKGKIIVRNSPLIKNSHLIGAGNKFPSIRDTQGNIQWRLSVAKQAEPTKELSALSKTINSTLRSPSPPSQNRTPQRNISTPNI